VAASKVEETGSSLNWDADAGAAPVTKKPMTAPPAYIAALKLRGFQKETLQSDGGLAARSCGGRCERRTFVIWQIKHVQVLRVVNKQRRSERSS
jgi:hypothetical protein